MMKRFTLMMMVLCFLMSIPLKMMAQTTADNITVVSRYKQSWGPNSNFNFTTTDGGNTYTCVLKDVTAANIWFRIVKNGTQWGPESSSTEDLVLTSEYQQAYANSTNKAFQIITTSGQTTYTITWDNVNNQIKYVGEATTPGGGDTPTPATNPLKGRVYTHGYYLAGNFFNFSENNENKVTYDDAVFKFQEQKNDDNGNAVYRVEIPASLTAHAQVMSVDEFGEIQEVYGPGSAYEIDKDSPTTGATTGQLGLIGSETLDETLAGGQKNYWDIATRNVSADDYSDGMYEVFITVNKTTGKPTKWEFKHIGDKRVAFFISDAKNATAMPLYDTYKKNEQQFTLIPQLFQ